jgi:hypothetical protein
MEGGGKDNGFNLFLHNGIFVQHLVGVLQVVFNAFFGKNQLGVIPEFKTPAQTHIANKTHAEAACKKWIHHLNGVELQKTGMVIQVKTGLVVGECNAEIEFFFLVVGHIITPLRVNALSCKCQSHR